MTTSHSIAGHHVTASAVPGMSWPMKPVDRRTLGGWKLEEFAGAGQFSRVYFGRPIDADDGPCDYAIKELHPEFASDAVALSRFRQEAVIGISVEHPNLATVLSAHFDCEPSYIVMPRLRGLTVAQLLKDVGSVELPLALWIARQVAAGLAALHQAGWIHADVKPQNLFMDAGGHVTLLDFGLAVPVGSTSKNDAEVRGTFEYAAPETFTSRHGLCPASDTYSLGVVLYEMLAGRRPFKGRPARLVESHIHQPPASLRSHSKRVPKEVARLVSRMLSKTPGRRPSCQDELHSLLTRLEIDHFSYRSATV